jgi:hypothetical protein
MEEPTFKWMTAARVLGLDWTKGWPKVLTEYQVAQLQAMSDEKDLDTFDMDVMRWKHKLRMAEIASVAEPFMVAKLATDDDLPPIQLSMYTADQFLKCCKWVGVEPSPYAQEWVESQIGPPIQNAKGQITDSIAVQTNQEREDSIHHASSWHLGPRPVRERGYNEPLYEYLEFAHRSGHPIPKARDVINCWHKNKPHQLIRVTVNEVEYFTDDGSKTASIKAIQAAIRRLTTPK